MKITDWLTQNKISDADFAERIGVTRQALWRYKAGDRIPKVRILERIQHETCGEVRPADFFSISETAA
jgi:transcriptional regulator with XRE-family HTH domain